MELRQQENLDEVLEDINNVIFSVVDNRYAANSIYMQLMDVIIGKGYTESDAYAFMRMLLEQEARLSEKMLWY